jgi:hypothetical protein
MEDDSEVEQLLFLQEERHRHKAVTHEQYDSDMEEILSQLRNLQERLNLLEKKLENQS